MSTKAIASIGHQQAVVPSLPFVSSIAAVMAAIRAHLAHREAVIELSALDDRMLKDIGIDRSEITSVLSDRSGERMHQLSQPF